LAPNPAYLDGLKLLARRELSEAQLRQRLARKGHQADEIERAVEQLRAERAVDDERVAAAIARTEAAVRRRGRARVQLQIERAGIAKAIARRAIEAVFGEIDGDALLAAALQKRLRGRRVADERERQRLYRSLVNQGFDPDRVLALLHEHQEKDPER
jgi:regulatory protein